MRLFFILLLLCSLKSSAWASPDGFAARLERAQKLDDAGRNLEAAEAYKVLFSMKNWARLMVDTGNAYLKGKDAQQARDWCARYLQESGLNANESSRANECVRQADALLKAQQRPFVKSTAARRTGQGPPAAAPVVRQATSASSPAVKPIPVPAALASAALSPPAEAPAPRPVGRADDAPALAAALPQAPESPTAAPAAGVTPAASVTPASTVASPPPAALATPSSTAPSSQLFSQASQVTQAGHAAPAVALQSLHRKRWLAVGLSVGAVGVAALAIGLGVGIPRSQERTDWLADLPEAARLSVKF